MAEDKNPPGSDTFIKGVLAELRGQTKKLVVSKLLVFGVLALSGIMGGLAAWLKSATDLGRGMLWGSALTLGAVVVAILAYSTWLHLRSRKEAEPIAVALWKARRKKNPTLEDYRAHAVGIADKIAMAERASEQASEYASILNRELRARGLSLDGLPEETKKAVAMEYLLGPRED